MKVEVEKLSVEELNKKIEAIKAERERTANALKRYEEELERKKQEVPLGVPIELTEGIEKSFYLQPALSVSCGNVGAGSMLDKALGVFHSKESAEKHAEMLLAWRMALVAIAKGNQIDITVLLPLMKKGWVAMDKDEEWFWYECKPSKEVSFWDSKEGNIAEAFVLSMFNLKPAENWEDSLMECGL